MCDIAKLELCQNHIVFAGCRASGGADIVFVLDGSGSIGSTNFDLCKDFVKKVIEQFEIGEDKYRIGVQQYASCKYGWW